MVNDYEGTMNPDTDMGRDRKVRLAKRCFIGEFAAPNVKWVEGAVCPECDSDRLMDAGTLSLCVSCNKFVKAKKKI